MQTLNRTFLPDTLNVKGKVYTRLQHDHDKSIKSQAIQLEAERYNVIILNVLSRNLKGKTDIWNRPYKPTQWLFVNNDKVKFEEVYKYCKPCDTETKVINRNECELCGTFHR